MASRDPFNFATSAHVVPVPCTACGNNMHCVRRTPAPGGEHQRFACAVCGNESERTLGPQPSDAAIQAEAENCLGIDSRQV